MAFPKEDKSGGPNTAPTIDDILGPYANKPNKGTSPPRKKRKDMAQGRPRPNVTGGGGGGGGGKKNNKKKEKRLKGVLNPRFDPRMRGVGSPLNRSGQIKRGWIQSGPYEDTDNRVNFLFNPSSIDVTHAVDPDRTLNPKQSNPNDPTRQFKVGAGSTVSLSLLYDRTYEMFSPAKGDRRSLANQYGVFADVSAWYYFLKMIEDLPDNPNARDWSRATIKQPLNLVTSYLYVGPRMVYYGYVSSLNVTFAHWSQHMIPIRCKIDISFTVIPDLPTRNKKGAKNRMLGGAGANLNIFTGTTTSGWASDDPYGPLPPVGPAPGGGGGGPGGRKR